MAKVICNTSPLQYLHQLGLLHLLPILAKKITVPSAVWVEIETGRENAINLPDLNALNWVDIRQAKNFAVMPFIVDLGAGEAEVLALALESPNALVILYDLLARKTAERLGIRIIGTLGVLLEAKRKNLISEIKPVLADLEKLRFRLSTRTTEAVLKMAGESL